MRNNVNMSKADSLMGYQSCVVPLHFTFKISSFIKIVLHNNQLYSTLL